MARRSRCSIVGASVALAISCGRISFQTRSFDAGGDATIDAPPALPRLVAMTGSSTGDGSSSFTSWQVTVPTIAAGDLVIVAIAEHHGDTVTGVVDDANRPLTSAGARAFNGGTASELWFESDAMPATGITVTINTPSNFDVWVAEFAGTASGAPASVGGTCLQYPPTIVSVPVTTTVPNQLVMTVMMAAAPMYVSGMLPPFTSFPPITGNDAGYLVAAQPGSYGQMYGIASGSGMNAMTCASAAVWMPAP